MGPHRQKTRGALMGRVCPETVKLYYEESKAARAQVEALLDKYRTNTSTLLALASAAIAFFGFSTGPRQPVCYWISIAFYGLAVAVSFLIFVPIPTKVNVAYNTAGALAGPAAPIIPTKLYYDYAVGHQNAINHALKIVDGKFGIATRFRALIIAVAVLIVSASLSVALGTERPPNPTHVIVDRGQ
jgi:hypothetical protein